MTARLRGKHTVTDDRGQEAVEFALLFPVMMLLIMGLIEFGALFGSYIMVTSGAREGVRLAAVRATDTDITNRVRAATGGLDQARLTVDIVNSIDDGGVPGQTVSVSVTYNAPLWTPLLAGAFGGGSIPLADVGVMRLE